MTWLDESIMDKAAPVLAKLDILHLVRRIATILPRTHLAILDRVVAKSTSTGNQTWSHLLPPGLASYQEDHGMDGFSQHSKRCKSVKDMVTPNPGLKFPRVIIEP